MLFHGLSANKKIMAYLARGFASQNLRVFVPDLPGCVAVANTRPAVVKLIREAVELHLEDMQEQGIPLPRAAAQAESIEVAV